MATEAIGRTTGGPGPASFQESLEALQLTDRIDELEPLRDDPADVELAWASGDDRLAPTIEAASHGELTPAEALDSVAAALGHEDPVLDEFDPYEY